MKHTAIYPALGLVLAISACAGEETTPVVPTPETPIETGVDVAVKPLTYDDTYYVAGFWAGEYPNGFAVSGADVVVQARPEMHIDAPRDVSCPLAQNANYHPWNSARGAADELEFRSVIEKTAITIIADVSVEANVEDADAPVKLDLKTGDTLTYLSYLGEGYFIAEHNGQEVGLDEGALIDAATFEEAAIPQQWVKVRCSDASGTRAWILYEDAIEQSGITGPQMAAYGEAYDLDDERMENAFAP